ncbi:MAG: Na+/H+ antiporter subunit E [Verrucomicrobiota bacterium]|nr:Na+/H+ antiporter subunit E [Verrucomicrobiota bacterium]
MKSFVLHLSITILWLLLSDKPSLGSFVVGIFIGFVLLYLFQPALQSYSYIYRGIAFFKYTLIFTWAFLASSVNVAWISVIRDPQKIKSGFLRYDVTGLSMVEIIILSYSIGLTPGTTPADLEDNDKTLVIHVLELDDPEAVSSEITTTLRNNILGFTRHKDTPL